jgi:hypothetical protein
VLGTFIVVILPISIATGDNIKSSDWIGFSGSVLAGAITLLAAVIAWFAVQRQINAQEDAESRATARLAEQRDADMSNAKEAAKIVLTHPVHAETGRRLRMRFNTLIDWLIAIRRIISAGPSARWLPDAGPMPPAAHRWQRAM